MVLESISKRNPSNVMSPRHILKTTFGMLESLSWGRLVHDERCITPSCDSINNDPVISILLGEYRPHRVSTLSYVNNNDPVISIFLGDYRHFVSWPSSPSVDRALASHSPSYLRLSMFRLCSTPIHLIVRPTALNDERLLAVVLLLFLTCLTSSVNYPYDGHHGIKPTLRGVSFAHLRLPFYSVIMVCYAGCVGDSCSYCPLGHRCIIQIFLACRHPRTSDFLSHPSFIDNPAHS
ncbi:hypothetical protein Ae201684_017851 [Aphanomyces euteiches]|uniref:Uncharacterized protein n=1 Tax=Aphanomyces euteiches TaxID=100861 RepID=A0A6G0W8T5_9STRA|nr:hypothetical protein Ae201684_017851 [Aphanomyces euteiches]